MNKNNIITLIRNSLNVRSEMIEQTEKHWLIKVYGEYKDMNKAEVGFSNKQLEQLKNLIVEIVPPMIEKIVDQKLEPFKHEVFERLDNIENDIKAIKNCPTIKKELAESEPNN